MRVLALSLLFAAAACNKNGTDDSGPGDADTDADGDADSDTDADTDSDCVAVNSGDDWAWHGGCPQMTTPCDIVVTDCALEIDYEADGGMTMGMPFSATIAGDVITFVDDNSVNGCVGTVEDADTLSGSCDGGCEFTLTR